MKDNINSILNDLYMMDPSLKEQEEDLKKLIQKLIEAKPDIEMNEAFVENLRHKLNARADELGHEQPASHPNFMTIFKRFFYPFASGLLGFAIVIVIVLQFDTSFKSFLLPEKTAIQAPQTVTFEDELPVVGDLEVGPAEEPVEEPGEEKSLPPATTKSRAIVPQPLVEVTEEPESMPDDEEMPEMMTAMAPMMMVEESVESDDFVQSIKENDMRDKANNLLLQIEKLMEKNNNDISDELKTSVDEKVSVLTGLLEAEKHAPDADSGEDIEAIAKAIEELEKEARKIDPEFESD
ncbi:hypothetical protein ACFL6I_21450 [candidate division KSB1 bacterium]